MNRPRAKDTNMSVTTRTWAGRATTALVVLFLLVDCGLKIAAAGPAIEGTTQLGYPAHLVVPIGVIELLCLLAYVVPTTSALGAVLLTGYLGGAIATHLRVGSPLLGFTLFPVYVAALVWGGLFLRDARLRVLVPFSR
jgi:hypothetical protein